MTEHNLDADMTHLRVMSYNIRYNTPEDGGNAWPNRKDRVAQLIANYHPTIMGLQEVLANQLEDLQQSLPDYSYVGVGRDDGASKGEYAPIFYLEEELELLSQGTFWLSETPGVVGSRGWDARLPRLCTWAELQHKISTQTFYHFNTHFDHLGVVARENSATLLLKKIASIAGNQSTIVTGDFNAEPDSVPYQLLSTSLNDAFITASQRAGDAMTFLGFKVGADDGVRIDYVFCSKDIIPKTYETLTDSWQGYYPSDHLPVLVSVAYR